MKSENRLKAEAIMKTSAYYRDRDPDLMEQVHALMEREVGTGVVRKGSRALQRLPASTDAFVWLRLYQQETRDLVPKGPKEQCGGLCAVRSDR